MVALDSMDLGVREGMVWCLNGVTYRMTVATCFTLHRPYSYYSICMMMLYFFFRPHPFSPYQHLLAGDPSSAAAASRPFLLAAGLYGAAAGFPPAPPAPSSTSLAFTPPPAPPSLSSVVSPLSSPVSPPATSASLPPPPAMDLTHHLPTTTAGHSARAAAAAAVAAVHPFLQLQKAASSKT